MARKLITLATATTLLAGLVAPSAALAAAPAPMLHNDNASGNAGDWYTGAVPANVDYSKPVVLFVQGLHSNYGTWVRGDGSGFYDYAYNNGFRTAFVQLTDADGGGGTPWTNGQMLANVINKVRAYYGVNKINIVAHSKGGIDTNSALIHYGAAPYVNVVHQVATPNRGSELADLSYGSWTWWLGALLGQQDDAVYSLQTSWMANFRTQSDSSSANSLTRTYLSAGTGDDGLFSATWFGHAVLPGDDDGAVATYSAWGHPHGVASFQDNGTEKLSHGNMVLGAKTWKYVQPKLTTASFAALGTSKTASKADLLMPEYGLGEMETSNKILRGGAVNGQVQDRFSLESGLDAVNLDVMTAQAATKVKLVSPSGKVYNAMQQQGAAGSFLFANAVHNTFSVAKPEQGEWQVVVEGANDAYFLLADLAGGSKATVKANKKVLNSKTDTVDLSIKLDGVALNGKQAKKAKLTKSNKSGKVEQLTTIDLRTDSTGNLLASLATPGEAGVYNLSFDLEGTNAAGEVVHRSVNYNFAVTDGNGKL